MERPFAPPVLVCVFFSLSPPTIGPWAKEVNIEKPAWIGSRAARLDIPRTGFSSPKNIEIGNEDTFY
jgi:hypothetical protein